MTISAKRFTFLDQETNVPLSDFYDPGTSDIFNSPQAVANEIDTDLAEFLEKSFGQPNININQLTSDQSSKLRVAKDAFSSLKDIGSFSQKDIDKAVIGMFPGNPTAQAAYKALGQCRTSPFGRHNYGRPYDPKLDCNSRNRRGRYGACNASGFNNILDKLTNGQYSGKYKDLNQSLANLVALATQGYSMNMCGVFGALSGDMEGYVKSRGAAMMLGTLGTTGNLRGMFDLSGAMAGMGPSVMREIPNGISGVLNNFQRPFDARESEYSTLNETTFESLENFDGKWNVSDFDDVVSTKNSTVYSDDLSDIMRGDAMNYNVDEDDLDSIPLSTNNDMRCGILSSASSFAGGFFG